MKQEDKELLLRDLCARIPYGVICIDNDINFTGKLKSLCIDYDTVTLDNIDNNNEFSICYIKNIKPYLFPMSSMTEEQEIEFKNTCNGYCEYYWTEETFDWLNKNHFDYRGLIPKNLANDATGLNIY